MGYEPFVSFTRSSCAGVLALALLAGCSEHRKPLATQPPAEPMPYPTTPVKAVRALPWSLVHRAAAVIATLFGDDYLCSCAKTDSAGKALRGYGLTRFDEIESARNLFVGGGALPPANHISLQFDQNLIPQSDDRPGKQDPRYHRAIITSTVIRIRPD